MLISDWSSDVCSSDLSEFEGKKATGNRKEGEYEFLHGPLCNQLSKFLRKSVNSDKTFAVKSNQHVDAAIIDVGTKVATAIFEVKTAALQSAQIYSAIGQLFYSKFKRSEEHTSEL